MTENCVNPMVKFYCPECGHEMRGTVDWDWDTVKEHTLGALRTLLTCPNCLLEEIRADKEKAQ